ncbi:MAG: L-aspartate oxidase [Firmicutes bacterium]|nr:L-aspartate oxidase [Bacillota bacterium]
MERGYVVDNNAELLALEQVVYDVVVVGSGIAGMTVAIELDKRLKVALLSKAGADEASTYKAQGGMAVAVGADDSAEQHIMDTLNVGQGLCRREAVSVLADEGPSALEFLLQQGVAFNKNGAAIALTREAGHSLNRVAYHYDFTGRHISETLFTKVKEKDNIQQLTNYFVVDVLTQDGQGCGVIAIKDGKLVVLLAKALVIATGGYAGIFASSTNSRAASGDGIAALYRAGAVIADLEFVQFHPTAFCAPDDTVFLLTEALRGEGALLVNAAGHRFMPEYHPAAELAPRDVVSRASVKEIERLGRPVFIDCRHLEKKYLADRFRQVYTKLTEYGYYLEKDLVPVSPAAHYSAGGIRTDLWGRSSVQAIYACGEAAATGVHGANRLASNSLLEAVVFGRRVAKDINNQLPSKQLVTTLVLPGNNVACPNGDLLRLGVELNRAAGVVRSGAAMTSLLAAITGMSKDGFDGDLGKYTRKVNAFQLAKLLLQAAIARQESRGTHFRSDYPEKNDEYFQRHILLQWGKGVWLE